MSDRTHPVIADHLLGILTALENESLAFPVGEWERPDNAERQFVDPPYAVVRIYPSTSQFDGPLSDSQADVVIRFQILGVGYTHLQSLRITDRCRKAMVKSKISITDRSVMDIRLMVTTGGEARDDDLPTPFHYSSDLYELQTTPAD